MKNISFLIMLPLVTGLVACSSTPSPNPTLTASSISSLPPLRYGNYTAQPPIFKNNTLTFKQKNELDSCTTSSNSVKKTNGLDKIYGTPKTADLAGAMLIGCLGEYGWKIQKNSPTGFNSISSTTAARQLMGLEKE